MNWLKNFWKALNEPVQREASFAEMAGLAETKGQFTPRAQQVLALARKEAARFNHNFVGTEHLLLGLIRLDQGVAVNVLKKLGLELETVRQEIERQVGTGPDQTGLPCTIPYTPRVKKVLAMADDERRSLNHTYLGTEHILLGILREGDGVAGRVLKSLDVDAEQTRQEILKELDPNYAPDHETKTDSSSQAACRPQPSGSPDLKTGLIDISKRYDVYCTERQDEVVVYRNALFKGIKKLLPSHELDPGGEFVELVQAGGQTIFLSRVSVIKFCEHGTTPDAESVLRKEN